MRYTYDAKGQLVRVKDSATKSKSGVTWNFTYDADGLRTKRTDGSNTYLYYYDGGLLRCMAYNGVKMFFTYDAQGMPVSMTYNGNIYFYVLNLQGDVMALLDANGNEVVSYHYNAWGEIISTTASTTAMLNTLAKYNPLRYRGYVYDRETGLYYVSSRYYNPEICRFISADDITYLGADGTPLSYNLYSYCKNNPVFYSDPTGHFGLAAAIIATGAIVGGLLGAFSAATTGGNILESAIEGCVTGAIGAACGILIANPITAVAVAAIGGAATDFVTQGVTQYIETQDLDLAKIDYGRVVKTGSQTGIGTAIPAFGEGASNAIDAFGTALIWAEGSTMITCLDIIFTKLFAATQVPIPKPSTRYRVGTIAENGY